MISFHRSIKQGAAGSSRLQWAAASVSLVALLAGCANYAGISSDKTMTQVSTLDAQQSLPAEGGQWPSADWAASFGDPQLPQLINEALANSPTIAEAQARVAKAAAYAEGANSALFPNVSARAGSTRERYSGNALYPPPYGGSWFTEDTALLSASYDLDLWGKHSQALARAVSERKAADAQAQQARLTLAASVARTYNELARAYALREVAASEIAQRQDIGRITSARVGAGLDTQVEVRTSDANTASAQTEVARLDGVITLTRYQLGALLGKGPDRGLSITQPTLGYSPISLPDNLPADLLSRRPDVVAARWQVDAMTHGIKSSKAAFYPDVNLAAAFGFDSFGFGRLFNSNSRQIQAGPAINLPIFDAGALRAQLKGDYADFDSAVANYNDTLNHALNDVATQVASIRSTDAQLTTARQAYEASQKAYELAVIRYKGGLSTQIQVLIADMTRLTQRQTLVQLQMDRRAQQVALIQAMGGGFEASAVGLAAN